MAQRLTQLQRMFYGVESTEGTEVLGTATEAFLVEGQPTFNISQAHIPRKFRSNMGFYTGVIGGHPDPGLSFRCELKNRGATSNVPDIDELLKTVFGTRTLDTGDATVSSATTTVLTVDDTTGFTAGNAVAVETGSGTSVYEVRWIASVDSGTQLTLTQALTFTPASGATVKPSLTFAPASSGHQSLSFQMWLDATDYLSFLGCKGSCSIEVPEAGSIPYINFNWSAMSWAHTTSGSRPSQTFGDSGNPPVALSSGFAVDGTETDIRSFSVDMAQALGRKMSHNSSKGTAAILVVDREPTFSLSLYDADQSQFTGWNAGTQVEISHQFGTTLNNMVAVQIPQAQRTTVSYGDDTGLTTDEVEGQCQISSGNDEMRVAFL